MRILASLLLALCILVQPSGAQGPQPVTADQRMVHSLNGQWRIIIDPYENGYYNYRYEPYDLSPNPSRNAFFTDSRQRDKSELLEYDFDRADSLLVPGDWNTQKERLFYYEGTVWYRTRFTHRRSAARNRVLLHFGAVNYQAEVYLNGVKLGRHVGGFTPFSFEVTNLLSDTANSLVVKVDNKRTKEGVPTLNTDWWNYGGITRDVQLIETPAAFIRDAVVQLDQKDPKRLCASVTMDGATIARLAVRLTIPELNIDASAVTDSSGAAAFDLPLRSAVHYWSPADPKLYDVMLRDGDDVFRDRIGLRTIAVKGTEILLNGAPVFLRGISMHEESPFTHGRAHTREDALRLLTWAKELGCNYVRLAHYPHNETMVRTADSLGLLVWEEIPVYWTIDWRNDATYRNAEAQLEAMVTRDRNRAAVIIWSMANETPNSPARLEFLTKLADKARALDGTRLISAALEQSGVPSDPNTRVISDPFAEKADILAFNQYVGWYDGLPEKCLQVHWNIAQQKPVVISEFGADAKYGVHGDTLTRFSEEYQEDLYTKTLRMLDGIPQLRGISPWILVDFRSPRRPLPGIQDGWNRKGLLSENGEKKKAFFVLQRYYQNRAQKERSLHKK